MSFLDTCLVSYLYYGMINQYLLDEPLYKESYATVVTKQEETVIPILALSLPPGSANTTWPS